MSRHRRPGVFARMLCLRRPLQTSIPAPRRAGIELVDARSGMAHQVSPEELRVGRARGNYQARCGARLLVASLTDPGCSQCPRCAP
jgi:hypothetical protein